MNKTKAEIGIEGIMREKKKDGEKDQKTRQRSIEASVLYFRKQNSMVCDKI